MPRFETILQDLYKLLQHPYGNACHNMNQMGQRFSLHHSGARNASGSSSFRDDPAEIRQISEVTCL